MSLEADVAYLHLIDGVRQAEVPAGFAVRAAPRRAARGRDRDLLMLGLHPGPAAGVDLLDLAANVYFGTPGSVTAAARASIQAVNAKLLDLNRFPPAGGPVSSGLTCAVQRGADLYVAQSGPGQVLVLHQNVAERFPDPAAGSKPLGATQPAEIQYFHTVLAPADFVLLTAATPAGWESASIAALPGGGLESAIARLTWLAGQEAASALVARFVGPEGASPAPGRRRVRITAAPLPGSPAPAAPPAAHPPSPAVEPRPAPAAARLSSSLAEIIARVRASPAMGESGPVPPALAETEAEAGSDSAPADQPQGAEALPALPAEPEPVGDAEAVQIGNHLYEFEEAEPEADGAGDPAADLEEGAADGEARPGLDLRARMAMWSSGLKRWFADLPLHRADDWMERRKEAIGSSVAGSGRGVLRRLLPEGAVRPGNELKVPEPALIAFAVLLPVLVGLAVGVVYVQRGRNQQYADYLAAARLEAGLARTAPDPLAAKPHWQQVLGRLDQAEAVYPGQPDAALLRAEAQGEVDAVENIQRLAFEPLVPGGFGGGAALTRVVVNGSEVYALDAENQRVYRAVLTDSDKFAIDRGFECRTGMVGTFAVDKIVDIAWLNTPNVVGQAALLALDDDGVLMYCKPDGSRPEASELIAPDAGWKAAMAIDIYADRLYVFDPGANEIWVYDRPGGVFSERPRPYFGGRTYDLGDAVSFAISQGEIYILRADGRLTYCLRDQVRLEANCVENVLFSDSRPGYANGERLADVTVPAALVYDPPPEPSLYLLDAALNSMYRLSLKLVLQHQYRPATNLGDPISAVALGPNKEMFVAAGNNVYWAKRP